MFSVRKFSFSVNDFNVLSSSKKFCAFTLIDSFGRLKENVSKKKGVVNDDEVQ